MRIETIKWQELYYYPELISHKYIVSLSMKSKIISVKFWRKKAWEDII